MEIKEDEFVFVFAESILQSLFDVFRTIDHNTDVTVSFRQALKSGVTSM